ncbi:DEAD/DEAH box helicase [Aspergillus saccharolyticus JOP 1030-1]|uniref:DNA repair protein RAD5 n=1 Tax=Aspergillus saccharolyticus JOP 1030-1 TaxID=1450539 RepID=A0A318Z961_9EURO|nr:DNA repair protein RAD5 [Aspergillus saccharolyticus JOP 1030-1]PYH43846.1 DNA repair protein RAD5 [Aspergillus saccharolyticus JOP 1030-1]
MHFQDPDGRPLKKRRFFAEDEDLSVPISASDGPSTAVSEAPASALLKEESNQDSLAQDPQDATPGFPHSQTNLPSSSVVPGQPPDQDLPLPEQQKADDAFDTATFLAIVGQHVPANIITRIFQAAGGDLERAVNIFFDGSWKTTPNATSQTTLLPRERALPAQPSPPTTLPSPNPSNITPVTVQDNSRRTSQPRLRYIGAFGVGAWATRSGVGLVKHGEHVKIERARSQPVAKRGRTGKIMNNQKGDVLTRFTTKSGQEIGRLPRETAEWVSTLLDQKVCELEGICVFAPDRIRVNDTIYLQLWCYLRIEAFQPRLLDLATDDNRSTTIFEEKESIEEKNLRLRQVALVKLFDEIGLQPTSVNDMTKQHKKEGLLRAAEMADQYDRVKKENQSNNDSSEEEETPELEQDQLDTLYKKAQSFDFGMPEAHPPSTFTLDLRKYQRQALHWMLAKETDKKSARAESLHPLWEQYSWPTKDVDDKELPAVKGIDYFYVNPYSGELTLEFPKQEQHCLGGILADEMGLGKTIEMLSLVHSHRNEPRNSGGLVRLPQSSTGRVSAPYTTLVIAPTSLLAQWESEALKASQPGTLKVLMYYGTEKNVNLRDLCAAGNAAAPNVIITSYGVVLAEHRHHASTVLSHMGSGGLFSLDFFRIIIDEAHMIKNRQSKSAKACYDLSATHRWVLTGTPIVNRLEDLFSLVRFLKVEPWNNFSFWKTFITVPFESKDYVRALNVVQTVLEPLVLRRTKTMKTPEGEPLVPLPRRTIQIEEVELPEQEREIYDLIYTRAKQTFNSNVEAGTLLKSYSTIFAQILRLRQTCCHPILTRNKAIVADEEDAAAAADGASDLKDDMDLQELIDRFKAATEAAGTEQAAQDSQAKFTSHALRQIQTESSGECPICSEEPMIEPAVTACWHSACKKCLEDYIRHQTDKGVPPRCFSCRGPITSKDIFEVIRHPSPTATPTEETDIYNSTPPLTLQAPPPPRISLRRIHPLSPSAHTSAKIQALLNHLTRLPSNNKAVVFSQFTSFLDLISPQLARAGIPHARLDGTMPQKARAETLAQFNQTETFLAEDEVEEDSEPLAATDKSAHPLRRRPTQPPSSATANPRVLLISLRAGGVGLNLTVANHVFMMDPWWSFAIEAQAIDRVHRMGQLRDVSVTRFVVKDSIEGRMLRVQERKMNIAGSLGLRVGGDGSEDEKKKERIEELKLLFE